MAMTTAIALLRGGLELLLVVLLLLALLLAMCLYWCLLANRAATGSGSAANICCGSSFEGCACAGVRLRSIAMGSWNSSGFWGGLSFSLEILLVLAEKQDQKRTM
jgi:hypothetical protein